MLYDKDCVTVISTYADEEYGDDAVEPQLQEGYLAHERAKRIDAVGKQPCHDEDGKCCGDGKNKGQQITCLNPAGIWSVEEKVLHKNDMGVMM